ncbi:DEAD/DEAH box helicase family protein [Streptomyces lasalocidi]
MPTLDLAAQAALAWRGDGHGEHMVIVSSMDASARKDLAAARVGSTNKATALAALMSVVGPQPDQIPALTVICTYDSLDKIENTQHTRYEVPPFDLAVMDEAHRIAGRTDKKWAVINDATLIRAERRLYMTATPRTFAAPELAQSQADTRPADSVPSRIRTRPQTAWTTRQSTERRSSSTLSRRRSPTAWRRTTASWSLPSATPNCAPS